MLSRGSGCHWGDSPGQIRIPSAHVVSGENALSEPEYSGPHCVDSPQKFASSIPEESLRAQIIRTDICLEGGLGTGLIQFKTGSIRMSASEIFARGPSSLGYSPPSRLYSTVATSAIDIQVRQSTYADSSYGDSKPGRTRVVVTSRVPQRHTNPFTSATVSDEPTVSAPTSLTSSLNVQFTVVSSGENPPAQPSSPSPAASTTPTAQALETSGPSTAFDVADTSTTSTLPNTTALSRSPTQTPVTSPVSTPGHSQTSIGPSTASLSVELQTLSPTGTTFLSSSSTDSTSPSAGPESPLPTASRASILGPILGGSIGGTVLLAAALILARCLVLKRRKRYYTGSTDGSLAAVESDPTGKQMDCSPAACLMFTGHGLVDDEVKPQEDVPGPFQNSYASTDSRATQSSLHPREARPDGVTPRELGEAGSYLPVWGERQPPPLAEHPRRATFSSLASATNGSLFGDPRHRPNSPTPAPSYRSRSTLLTEDPTVFREHPLEYLPTAHPASPPLPAIGSRLFSRDALMGAEPVRAEDANYREDERAKGAEASVRLEGPAVSSTYSGDANRGEAISDDPPPAYEP
ncbi:hypothetical protein C8Q79DRAFT_929305 [Trametes meyenii]|nr:hypothetical protein C8Q79DRAFT_929305 [Trametes meyenii]